MVDVGYLTQTHKHYRPSIRVALLGSWVASDIAPEASVLKMMEWVGAQCSQTIVLAVPEPVQVLYIRVVPATSTMRMHVTPGTLRPYPTSGLGRLFLSKMSDEKIVEIVHVYSKHQAKEGGQLNPETIRREILSIRKEGVSVSMDQVSPGEGVVAIHLPSQDPKLPLAIGIGGSSQLIREKQNHFKELLAEGQLDIGASLVDELAKWFPGHVTHLDSALYHWMCKKQLGEKPVVIKRSLNLQHDK